MPIKNKQIQVTSDFNIANNKLVNTADPVEVLDAVNKRSADTLQNSIGTYSIQNKNMNANLTSSDGDLAVNNSIADVVLSAVNVKVNGKDVNIGFNKTCYFQNPNPPNEIRLPGYAEQGDQLKWNGSIAKYQLDISDTIQFWYLTPVV